MHNHFHSVDPSKMNPRYALLASIWAVATVTILIGIKTYAYYQSNSASILGSLTDSITDAGISIMMLFAVRLSLKPADKDHRHGHGKVEGIASLMQGAFMAGAGVFLAFSAGDRFIHPVIVSHHQLALAVSFIAIALSLIVVSVQKFSLRRAPSLAIEADHAHYKTDIALNGMVIVALFVDLYNGPKWLDPVFALFIAGYFLWTAFQITGRSVDMLMDKEMPLKIRRHIEEIVRQNLHVHGMHDLRTRQSGMQMHISFDVELYPDLSLKQAHDIVRELDHAILEHYPHAEIIIHMDPIGDTADPRHSVRGVHH
ncbi:MAG: cation diffusion facilitator family transporter [Alphaproteobacteria bacterium]|nr:cation diffusion facilitator family transporter [Alphaproteobacteria bacterium]